VMFMCGVWWRPRFLSKSMKAVSDKKKQKHLAGHTGPVPVDVSIRSETETEDYQFTPAAVGQVNQGTLYLPSAKSSPYDDQDGSFEESDEDEDSQSDALDSDDDE
jgi:hypothetical protein